MIPGLYWTTLTCPRSAYFRTAEAPPEVPQSTLPRPHLLLCSDLFVLLCPQDGYSTMVSSSPPRTFRAFLTITTLTSSPLHFGQLLGQALPTPRCWLEAHGLRIEVQPFQMLTGLSRLPKDFSCSCSRMFTASGPGLGYTLHSSLFPSLDGAFVEASSSTFRGQQLSLPF